MSLAQPPTGALESRRLIEDARTLGVSVTPAQAIALLQLLDMLAAWGSAYNLTALSERGAMISAHLLDSLSGYPDLRGQRIADVGTGAGFPGLPLALLCPERRFTLIDSVGKKIRFVTHAARQLCLANVTALQARVEALAPNEPFDTLTARAFAPLPQLLRRVRALCGPQSCVVAFKGRYPHAELAALPAGWQLQSARAVHIPALAAERHVLRLVPAAVAVRLTGP